MTNDDEGEGGVTIPPKIDDVIYEQPLMTFDAIGAFLMFFSAFLMVVCALLTSFCAFLTQFCALLMPFSAFLTQFCAFLS